MLAERRNIFTAKNHRVSFVNLGLAVLLLISVVLACSSGSSNVTVTCANECLAKIKDAKAKVETKCE